MYLFTRGTRLRPGSTREGAEWAVGITQKVNQITGLGVELWTTLVSPGVGTLSWTAFVERLGDLEDANAKLMVDDIFVGELDRGAALTAAAGADDEVAQVVHGEVDPSSNARYATVVRSELVPGGFARGMEAGVEIATRATAAGGLPTLFLVSTTGKYGGVAWITGAESLDQLETAEQRVNADAGFIRYVDEVAPGCFQPGITTQAIYSRIV